jgi:hypothetical protein
MAGDKQRKAEGYVRTGAATYTLSKAALLTRAANAVLAIIETTPGDMSNFDHELDTLAVSRRPIPQLEEMVLRLEGAAKRSSQ